MKKATSKKLLKYGTLSAAALGCSMANAQIIFTDIDDIDVFNDGPFVGLDIDGDGTGDFTAVAFYQNTAAILAAGLTGSSYSFNNNAFAGFTATNYNYTFNYPSNLAEGDIIDGTSPFTNPGSIGYLNISSCAFSNSQFCDGVVDGFIGVNFDIDNATHFGWIRVDIAADGSGYFIRDFAYEATPGTAIVVGETLSLEDNTIQGLTSFVANNALTLNARVPLENITIHTLTGQVVISQKLSNITENVDLKALSTGVYIATVETEGKRTAIKFVK